MLFYLKIDKFPECGFQMDTDFNAVVNLENNVDEWVELPLRISLG